ncbi:hypothetical protein VU04_07080 [Desulfobulbus sp. TB]|nr:hypothetical protein [Desulfobulbus sp. TB]
MKTDNEKDGPLLQPACNSKQQLEKEELVPSEKASGLINDYASSYVKMLNDASKSVARQEKADHEVTEDHVRKAYEMLKQLELKEHEKRSQIKVLSGIVSGALLGFALPLFKSATTFSSVPVYQALLLIFIAYMLGSYSK